MTSSVVSRRRLRMQFRLFKYNLRLDRKIDGIFSSSNEVQKPALSCLPQARPSLRPSLSDLEINYSKDSLTFHSSPDKNDN